MKRILLFTGILTLIFSSLSSFNNDITIDQSDPGCLDSLQVPERFTPNADKVNDVFEIHFPCAPEKFEIHVYDNFGEEVFHSEKHDFIWYGTNGKDGACAPGVYDWTINYTYQMKYIEISGQVLLLI